MHAYTYKQEHAYTYVSIYTENDMKRQQLARIKEIERKYERILLDKSFKHQKEIDVNDLATACRYYVIIN